MKTFKKLMPIVFTLVFITVMLFVTSASVGAKTYTGKCGNNLSWTLDTVTGVLNISGSGDMDDYSIEYYFGGTFTTDAPWNDYYESIKSIVVEDSVTSIGDYAFYYYYKLSNVDIGDSVKKIGDCAFSNCTVLGSVTIPNSVTDIGSGAFSYCLALADVTVGNSVKSIEADAFLNCSMLKSIMIPKSVTYIGETAFIYSPVTITCYKNSYAHQYAVKNGVDFDVYDDEYYGAFTDVKKSHWFYDAVTFVLQKGYMNGMSETKFSPNGNIKREQFVLILANIAGVDTNAYKYVLSGFKDVKTGQWYSGAVMWAANMDYVSGMTATTFGTGQDITRAQLARLFYVYAEKNGINVEGRADLSRFADSSKVQDWMRNGLEWAVDAGIISGMELNGKLSLNPNGTATRAQTAVMLKAFDGLVE